MVRSMTGYGKCDFFYGNKKIIIEARSLNSKQMDMSIRLPGAYRDRELELRHMVSERLHRGKVDLSVSLEENDQVSSAINSKVVKQYYQQLASIARDLEISDAGNFLSIVMRFPDTLETKKQEIDDEEWKQLFKCMNEVISQLDNYRKEEGQALQKDIEKRVDKIASSISQVEAYEQGRINKIKKRLEDSINEHLNNKIIDKERIEQEVLYYIEKLDITEEKVRLAKHCEAFKDNLKSDEPVGKKLGFIGQEMFREINTIGSKAADHHIQQIIVDMKDELEKVKEQLMNIL